MLETDSVLLVRQPIATVSKERVDQLKQQAFLAPLKRARLCLHHSHEKAVQEMVIAFHKDSYIRPHRHPNKTESFHMIEGKVLIAFFGETGEVFQTLLLEADVRKNFLYRLSSPYWHSVLCLTEFSVFHEVAEGPFAGSEYPLWEPQNTGESIAQFRHKILEIVQ